MEIQGKIAELLPGVSGKHKSMYWKRWTNTPGKWCSRSLAKKESNDSIYRWVRMSRCSSISTPVNTKGDGSTPSGPTTCARPLNRNPQPLPVWIRSHHNQMLPQGLVAQMMLLHSKESECVV